MTEILQNYIDGKWETPQADSIDVVNPATNEVLASVPLSPASEIDRAAQAAAGAFPSWRSTPAGDRVQYLFRFTFTSTVCY